MHYGFAFRGNPFNQETLRPSQFEPQRNPSQEALRKIKISMNDDQDFIGFGWTINPFQLLRRIRLTLAESEAELAFIDSPYDQHLETFRANFCVRLLRTHLMTKKTSLDRDFELLRALKTSGERNTNYYLALIYRIDQKKIILKNIDFCQRLADDIPCIAGRAFKKRLRYYRLLSALSKLSTAMKFANDV